MKTYSIALIPGDGIGKDVTAAAWAVLQAISKPVR
jgi:tartrate dehydrogenase/decarboxylase / D-malate dehydrogenase